jgi:hypothetical protein
MSHETIPVRTEQGKVLEVVVISKHVDGIWVVLGEGIHNVRCKLSPTRTGQAYAGSVMGREVVYERSVRQVQADIDRDQQALFKARPR